MSKILDVTTRRRVKVTGPGRVEVVTEPLPEVGPDEVLVRLLVAGVCGSDVHGAHGTHPLIDLPYYPGHEAVGTVEEVGAAVSGLTVGQRVTAEPPLPCWGCKMCRTGRSNLCENLEFFGCGFREGGMADVFTVRGDRLHVVPDDLDLEQASLIEPLATPVHAVRLAGDVAGKAVAVIGCGTIGLLVLAVLRARGARAVVMTDVLAAKRAGALAAGADAVVDGTLPDAAERVRAELGETADVVLDCVGVQATMDQAVDMVQRGGTVVLVGVPARPLQIPAILVQDRQLRIQGSATYLPEDYAESMAMLQAGTPDAASMITASYPLEEAAEAFEAAARGDQVKVLLTGATDRFGGLR
ncbi:2-desacetyl-2-hydroxyethyl bacteriochlorophyllide A dehydrogenase [Auraticoccus monumenti]|uniref:2-desacetyl-2-hydroxyethyl bacteriochlorophyllide A dehydrogenase n=1 Tax=Auraticoccus monumenti TaxID=675864 RepID=A0A1G6XT47_9ACTN|nr:2-desacetyl-2-hydroxyethyl bacteriochlorophyllide A dehydrogenase [Auraticoccus monumenti]